MKASAKPPARPIAKRGYWLVKSEPSAYSWDRFVEDDSTAWTGVRNFAARNNLATMQVGDQVLFYHSMTDKAVVGIATVARTAYLDPTAEEGDWKAVDLRPSRPLRQPVTLAQIKADPELAQIDLLRLSRLSVVALSAAAFKRIVAKEKAAGAGPC